MGGQRRRWLVTTPTSQAATIAWTSLENRLKKADTAARTKLDGYADVDDLFPTDHEQWADFDGDGWGDNYFWKTTPRLTPRTVKSSWCCENSEGVHSRRSPASGPTWTGTAGATVNSSNRVDNFHFDPQWGDPRH